MRYYAHIIFFALLCNSTIAQDIHFSQYSMSPLNLNPAFAGFFDGDYRGVANYRSQWTTVPVSYKTVSISADMSNVSKSTGPGKIGAGILFNNDVAGYSKYGTTQLYIPLSYIKRLNSDSSLFMSVGLQPGISNIGFHTDQLSFDNQWDGDAYNPALSSGENFPLMKRTYFDINSGAIVQYRFKQRAAVTLGIGMAHLTAPKISYFKNSEIKLDRKFTSYLAITYPVAEKIDLTGEYLFEKQGKYKENVLGAKIAFLFSSEIKQDINAGFYLRTKDAMIYRIGYDYNTWQFSMSYDVNTSKFQAATNRRGAIEFGLIYIFSKPKIFVPKQRACPIYM